MFSKFKNKNTNSLNILEFESLVLTINKSIEKEVIEAAFFKFDKNRNGLIDLEEFKSTLLKLIA